MRKSLLALFVGAAFTPLVTHAQNVGVIPPRSLATGESRVEIHGVIDAGIEVARMGTDTTTRLQSGQSAGTRLGFRGSEDLGGGYRAIFELEMRIELDNGSQTSTSPFVSSDLPPGVFPAGAPAPLVAPGGAVYNASVAAQQQLQRVLTTVNPGSTGFFDRQAFVGLVTPYGAILAGRMYTPGYEMLNAYNVFGDSTVGQFGQNYALLNIRTNNALAYRIRFFEALTVTAMYSFGGNETLSGGRNERAAAPRGADDFYGANARWLGESFDVGVGYNRNNTIDILRSESVKGLETLNVGGSVRFGPARVFAQFMKRKNDNPVFTGVPSAFNVAQFNAVQQFLSFQDADATVGIAGPTDMYAYHLGLSYKLGANGTLALAANHGDDRRDGGLDADVDHFAVGYFHDLSRRTTLYTAYGYVRNSENARMGLNSAGYSGGFTDRAGYDPSVFQLGVRHIF